MAVWLKMVMKRTARRTTVSSLSRVYIRHDNEAQHPFLTSTFPEWGDGDGGKEGPLFDWSKWVFSLTDCTWWLDLWTRGGVWLILALGFFKEWARDELASSNTGREKKQNRNNISTINQTTTMKPCKGRKMDLAIYGWPATIPTYSWYCQFIYLKRTHREIALSEEKVKCWT